MSDLVRVAVDAMGGDYAPVEPVKGAVEAVNADERVKVQLVGQAVRSTSITFCSELRQRCSDMFCSAKPP